jgi:Domain of unknown function (DUF4166)/Saccharopine dehydrogenase NADP binding domain
MTTGLKILIVGGYGVFGSRIVELLENDARLTLVVGGRSVAKAKTFAASRKLAKAELVPAAINRNGDIGGQLSAIRPDIVIDASGPFQTYGDDGYRVIKACLAQGANYLDLADGSDFVAGVGAFDDRAKAAGLYIVSGASSFPVLTAAAVRRLSAGMAAVKTIRGGIAPSPYAGVGENVIRAIAGYAGQPTRRKRDGVFCTGYPLTEHLRYTIAPPGRVPLHNKMFSLVDVPDLQALAALWPEADEIWMGAAPVPEPLHRLLAALAWLVRLGVLPTLSPIAPLMHFASNHIRWGEHRGGMFVEIDGVGASGTRLKRTWHLLAEGDDGPLIPSKAVEAIVRNVLQGRSPQPGARAAVRELELDAYEQLFAGRTIFTGTRGDDTGDAPPLYARIVGDAWRELPAKIRDMHDVRGRAAAEGRARVERGRGVLARLACAVIGFPQTNPDTSVGVQFDASNGVETWTRTFGSDRFGSRQFAGRGRSERLLCERFGALTFAMALVVAGERLALVLRRWSIFGLPLPMWLCPRSESYESAEQGRFNFHVRISHPLTGLIIRYDGWLVRKSS